jgi:hypothetical protein
VYATIDQGLANEDVIWGTAKLSSSGDKHRWFFKWFMRDFFLLLCTSLQLYTLFVCVTMWVATSLGLYDLLYFPFACTDLYLLGLQFWMVWALVNPF